MPLLKGGEVTEIERDRAESPGLFYSLYRHMFKSQKDVDMASFKYFPDN